MQARYSPVTYMYYRATSLTFDFIRDFVKEMLGHSYSIFSYTDPPTQFFRVDENKYNDFYHLPYQKKL